MQLHITPSNTGFVLRSDGSLRYNGGGEQCYSSRLHGDRADLYHHRHNQWSRRQWGDGQPQRRSDSYHNSERFRRLHLLRRNKWGVYRHTDQSWFRLYASESGRHGKWGQCDCELQFGSAGLYHYWHYQRGWRQWSDGQPKWGSNSHYNGECFRHLHLLRREQWLIHGNSD